MRCGKHGYLYPDQVKNDRCALCDGPVQIGKTEKMSKSLKNVVDPDYLIGEYGADTARLFCLFAAPPEKDLEWSDQGVEGAFRFLGRVWRLVMDYVDEVRDLPPTTAWADLPEDLKNLRRKTHQTIRKVTEDIEQRFHFNTAISAVMELVNALYQFPRPSSDDARALSLVGEAIRTVIVLLNPFVPHMTEELWRVLGGTAALFESPWPSFDPEAARDEEITIVIQINGKLRSRLVVPADERDEAIKEQALRDEAARRFIEGKTVRKVIYVPKKLVNIVVA